MTLGQYNHLTVMKVGANALAKFLDVFIVWDTAIVEELGTNRQINSMSTQKRVKYENATGCYICRHAYEKNNPKNPNTRDLDHITKFFLGAAHRQCNLERPVSFRIPVFIQNFRGYDAQLIVHKLKKRSDREIKVIGHNMTTYLQVE